MASAPGDIPRPSLTPADLGFGVLFDAIRDAVVVADERGTIVLWNRGAENVFGWRREEIQGRNVDTLVPASHVAAHHAGLARYAATGHGPLIDAEVAVELPALRKGGGEIFIELTLAPLEHERGRFALAVLRDVTERVRLRRDAERRSAERERANASLARANESLTAFTYVVSHDLKEPVRAIDVYLNLLREEHGAALPPDALDLVDRASLATRRLSALLKGLLDLSRVDRMDLQRERVSVGEVLESDACRGVYEDLLRERAGVLEAPEGPPVLATPSLLCQTLGNLVTNALRHNPASPPRVRVEAQRATGDAVEVRVEDNGRGFPPSLVARFNATGELGRTGFGLLIARRAVERLGGRMWLGSSEALGGASVRFTLPAAK